MRLQESMSCPFSYFQSSCKDTKIMYNFQVKGPKKFGKRNITLKKFGDVGEKTYLCGQIAKELRYEGDGAIGRKFPSNPHFPQFPQPEGKELEYVGMVLSEDSLNFPQGEGTEGSEGNSL